MKCEEVHDLLLSTVLFSHRDHDENIIHKKENVNLYVLYVI